MSQDHAIRVATRADAAELARLLSQLGHAVTADAVATVFRAWEAEGNSALVVPGASSLLGSVTLHQMVVLHRPHAAGRITSLVVDACARGKGLGRALVQAAEDALADVGCGLVEITSHARHRDAHDFYRHLGYEQTSLRFARVLP